MPGFDPVTAVTNAVSMVLDRVLPDKQANDAAKAQLLSQEVSAQIQQVIGQIEVDKIEAASNSKLVAGWRPWIGWTCGAAMGYAFILQPFFVTLINIIQCIHTHTMFTKDMLPIIDMTQMWPVLLALLGMGALRSWDKQNGTGNGQ